MLCAGFEDGGKGLNWKSPWCPQGPRQPKITRVKDHEDLESQEATFATVWSKLARNEDTEEGIVEGLDKEPEDIFQNSRIQCDLLDVPVV